MPWKEVSTMSLRREFVELAQQEGANRRALCRRFGISPTTGYRWLHRYQAEGAAGLQDRSRRPHHSPQRTTTAIEQRVLQLRDAHPAWGGRKIRRRLQQQRFAPLPSASTITAILRRHDRLAPPEQAPRQSWQRFERPVPNELWQLDFKGHFPLLHGGRCHPLTLLDDHSRFCLDLAACANERYQTVQAQLTQVFTRYGLPHTILADNGPPWGAATTPPVHTALTVWLLRLGVRIIHGRPYHPQTQGKAERFHRTLRAEVLRDRTFTDLATCQRHFTDWRTVYNCERPHEALGNHPPVSRYQPSPRPFPAALPPIEYAPGTTVRKVQAKGVIALHGRSYRVGQAFRGYPVAIQPTLKPDRVTVQFCHETIAELDLRQPEG